MRGRIEKVLDAAKANGHRSAENPARWRGHLDHLLPKPLKLRRFRTLSMNSASHGYAMYGLIVLITVAAFAFIDRFDFAGRPTQAIYIGIYLLVGLIIGLFFVRYGTGATNAQQT